MPIQVNYPTKYKLVTADPASASDGQLIFNTVTSKLRVWYASAWHDVIGSGGASGLTTGQAIAIARGYANIFNN